MEWPGKDGKHPRCPPKGNVAKGNDKWVGPIFFLPIGFRVALWWTHWHARELSEADLDAKSLTRQKKQLSWQVNLVY